MKKGYERKENFKQSYKNLNEEDKKELNEIEKELEKIQDENKNSNLPINDKELKKRIAKICLRLIEETSKDKTSIMKTSYIITGNFIWNNYGNELDEAIGIAGELELPERHISGKTFQMWEKMKNIFQQYLEE